MPVPTLRELPMTEKRKRNNEANLADQENFRSKHKAAGRTRREYWATPDDHKHIKALEQQLIESMSDSHE